jgi:hypothetical protein
MEGIPGMAGGAGWLGIAIFVEGLSRKLFPLTGSLMLDMPP